MTGCCTAIHGWHTISEAWEAEGRELHSSHNSQTDLARISMPSANHGLEAQWFLHGPRIYVTHLTRICTKIAPVKAECTKNFTTSR